MRKREFQLSTAKISAFREAEAETRNVYELKQLQVVRLYGMGESVESIQRLVGCGSASPRQGSILSKRAGLAGLQIAWATATRVWSPCGQTPTLRVATQCDHVHFYGALNLRSGQEVALPVQQQSSEIICHFLDHLQSSYPDRALFILWDRAK